MDNKKEQEIPFGAFDSELMHQEINIPEGFEATIEGNKIILTRTESKDEKIRKRLIDFFEDWHENRSHCWGIAVTDILAWLEKQGTKESNKMPIWKHWKDGIAGKGDGEGKPIYLIKAGNTYNLSSCIGFECDYIELSVLDKLLSEKQSGQKPISFDTSTPVSYDDILFGAKDYELHEATYFIPEGFHAEIDGDKVIIKRGEQKPFELPKGEEYGIDGLWHAISILQRTLGEVEGYQSDDGILEHKCAITAVKKLYKQKPAWSEEDERTLKEIFSVAARASLRKNPLFGVTYDYIKWQKFLTSIKDRIQPQPKQEWGKEDIRNIEIIDSVLFYDKDLPEDTCVRLRNWLKSLIPQNHWKPSKEQMEVLVWCMPLFIDPKSKAVLESLIKDLKKL